MMTGKVGRKRDLTPFILFGIIVAVHYAPGSGIFLIVRKAAVWVAAFH